MFFSIGIITALRYPLNRERFNQIKTELENRKAPAG